jgi:predicted dinucleotide-binding enzyme
MDTGRLGDRLTALVATDDPGARKTVLRLAGEIGFDAVDAGPHKQWRSSWPMGAGTPIGGGLSKSSSSRLQRY